MVEKKTTKKPLGCLLGIIGSLIGAWLGHLSFEIHAQKILAANPNRFICGNDALPGMVLGLIAGGISGMLFGKFVGRSRRR